MSKKLNLTPDPARSFRTPGGAVVSYMMIDATTARFMLDMNNKNRTVSDRQVAQYARALDSGDWPFTGDAIRLGPDGLVLDGQHRLLAIERTETPMECLIVSGLSHDVQRYLDSGRKRTAADQISLDGVANSTLISATSRLILSWEHWRQGTGTVSVSNAEVTEHVLGNLGQMEAAVKTAGEVRRNLNRVSGCAIAAAYARAVQVTRDPFLVANFFTRLSTGADLTLGTPLHTLRNTLIRSEQANRLVHLYLIVRAWNATQKDEALGKMQLPRGGVSTTKFPDMAEPKVVALTELDEAVADVLERMKVG